MEGSLEGSHGDRVREGDGVGDRGGLHHYQGLNLEAIIYRYRCGIAWRDLPEVYGPWQTVWTWHRRLAEKGTWDTVLATLTAAADAEGLIDWSVSVDSTIARAHQHATNITRHTGGWIELQESA